jgi:translation initiation factor IF-2
MADLTIAELAKYIGTDVDDLLKLLAAVGIVRSAYSSVSQEEKYTFLSQINSPTASCLA